MPALKQLETKINGAMSKTGNALSLGDNIVDNETVVGEFLDMGEGDDFLSSLLGGIKDFLLKISGAYGFLKDIIGKAIDLIKKLVSYLDLNKLFDALGIKYLTDMMVGVLGDMFQYGVLSERSALLDTLHVGCIDLKKDAPLDSPIANHTLTGILLGLACAGEPRAFTLLDKVLKNEENERHEDALNQIQTLINNLPLLNLNPEQEGLFTDTEKAAYILEISKRDEEKTALLLRIKNLEDLYKETLDSIDTRIAKIFLQSFNRAAPTSVESMLLDMSSLPAFERGRDAGDTKHIIMFVDKIDDLLSSDVRDGLVLSKTQTKLTYDTLIALLNRFDNSITQTRLLSTLAKLKALSLDCTPSLIAPDIGDVVRSMIQPRPFSLGKVKC